MEVLVSWVGAQEENSTEVVIIGILVVKEFADLFSDEVLSLPPNRKIDFTIDLLPRVGPMFMALHRMTSNELAELKK